MRQASLGFVAGLLAVTGCASYSAAPVTLQSPDKYPAHKRDEGLSIGARVYDGTSETAEVLGEDVTESFTPVHLSLECAAKERFLINRGRMRLLCSDGTSLQPVSAATMYAEYKHDVGGATFGGGAMGGASASEANDAMKTDWTEKEFTNQLILGPNQRLGGFVYFRGRCPKGPRVLKVSAERMKAGDEITANVELVPGPGATATPSQTKVEPEAESHKPTGRPLFGVRANLFGANALVSGGLALEWPPRWIGATTSRWLETGLTVGYRGTDASTVGASAAIKVTTFMLDARIWLGQTNAFLINVGTGFSFYDMAATDGLTKYKRGGTPGVTVVGIGYGYRSSAGPVRFSIIGGALVHEQKLNASTGSVDPSTRADLDRITDKLTDVQFHLELSLGVLF